MSQGKINYSHNYLKTQICIAVYVCVLEAIIKKRLEIVTSPYNILKLLSLLSI